MSNTMAIKEVLDFTVEEYSPTGRGEVLFTVDYAGQTNINTTAERLPIRGGQGNYKIMDIDHTKDVEFAATLPLIDIKALALKLGTKVTTGASVAPFDRIFTVADGGIVLPTGITPITNSLKIYKVTGKRDIGELLTADVVATVENSYAIADQNITFHEASVPVGSKVFVSFDYTTDVLSENIKITASDFPEEITIRGRGLVVDEYTKEIVPITFKVHNAKVKPEFEITMAGDSASELDFNCDCYAVQNAQGMREFVDIVKLNGEVD